MKIETIIILLFYCNSEIVSYSQAYSFLLFWLIQLFITKYENWISIYKFSCDNSWIREYRVWNVRIEVKSNDKYWKQWVTHNFGNSASILPIKYYKELITSLSYFKFYRGSEKTDSGDDECDIWTNLLKYLISRKAVNLWLISIMTLYYCL